MARRRVRPRRNSTSRYFYANYEAFSGGIAPSAPAADRSYDAGAIVGLAVAKAGVAESERHSRCHPVGCRSGWRGDLRRTGRVQEALALIGEGKAINYQGVIGN